MTITSTNNIILFNANRFNKLSRRYKSTASLTGNHYTKTLQTKAVLLAEQHVHAHQTSLVESCFATCIFDYDDIANAYIYYDRNDNELTGDALTDAMNDPDFDIHTEAVTVEIKCWHLVTDWLADKLLKKGEPILENDHGIWWGRAHAGSWMNNTVLQEIAQEQC